MNSKSKKLYSTLAATALVASAVAPVASATETEVTPILTVGNVTAQNGYATSGDTVTVKAEGLTVGSVINVYSNTGKTDKIGAATVATGDVTTVVKIEKGFTTTKVFVTNTKPGASESKTVSITVPKETSLRPNAADLSTTNNISIKDVVTVKNVVAKDVITVYADADKKTKIGSGTVKANATEVEVSISKGFGTYTQVFVTKRENGKDESAVTSVTVGSEEKTTFTSADTVEVINNVTKKDEVKVTGVAEKDLITVYSDAALTTVIGKGTAKKGKDELVVTISKSFKDINKVYVTKKSVNELESLAKVEDVAAEKVTTLTSADTAIITNNAGQADQLTIKGLKAKDKVVVYKGAASIGTATAKDDGELVITLKQQVATSDTVEFTVLRTNELVSAKITATHTNITSYDSTTKTVTVKGVKSKDVVTLYSDAARKETSSIGTATASANGDLKITIKADATVPSKIYVGYKSGKAAETLLETITVQ